MKSDLSYKAGANDGIFVSSMRAQKITIRFFGSKDKFKSRFLGSFPLMDFFSDIFEPRQNLKAIFLIGRGDFFYELAAYNCCHKSSICRHFSLFCENFTEKISANRCDLIAS